MLFREDKDGFIAISQPAHSWISGQLARHWGNELMGDFSPHEEVCLAAEQHDIGFLVWERSPTLNRNTSRPFSFLDMPLKQHLDIWSAGVQNVLTYSRYAALLVSLHSAGLCERHVTVDTQEKASITQIFLHEQRGVQAKLLDSLRADPAYALDSSDRVVARNRRLIAAWDFMSLVLCTRGAIGDHLPEVPASAGSVDLKITAANDSFSSVMVDPWPFRTAMVKVITEGRRLTREFVNEKEMRLAVQNALPITISTHLTPRQDATASAAG